MPGALASSCNPATWRHVLLDGLWEGLLVAVGSCRSGVRTKACINMELSGEPRRIRLSKAGQTKEDFGTPIDLAQPGASRRHTYLAQR